MLEKNLCQTLNGCFQSWNLTLFRFAGRAAIAFAFLGGAFCAFARLASGRAIFAT